MTVRKPTNLKVLHGTARPTRLNKLEPKPASLEKAPAPPMHLDSEAKGEWNRIAPVLCRTRVLAETDLAELERYCRLLSRARAADRAVEEQGMTYETRSRDGSILHRAHPEVGISESCWRQASQAAQQLGMTPASRGGVSTMPDGDREDEGFAS